MPTILRPPKPTFIISTTVVDFPDRVTSVFGRTGDIFARAGDYGIKEIGLFGALEITTLGQHEGDQIIVESNKFVLKPPSSGPVVELSDVQFTNLQINQVLAFNGTNWRNVSTISAAAETNAIVAVHAAVTDGVHGLIDTGAGTLFHSDDGSYKSVTHPTALVSSVFGRAGVVVATVGDYAIADITGLTTVGGGTLALFDDGTYKAVIHPTIPVDSVFGRTGVVIAAGGDYAIADITGLTTAGAGTDVLTDDGTYKPITHPPDAIDSVFGRVGAVVAANNDYTLPQIDGLIDSGAGNIFLADDGVYKATPAAPPRDVISPSVADNTTITSAFQTIFDFSPDAAFRNNNCLITIYYQAMNIGGPATWGARFRSLIGFTVQQNAYAAGVAQNVDSSERACFSFTMEGIVSATGNIQIQVFADVRDHDISNSAANGKTRLTIELV